MKPRYKLLLLVLCVTLCGCGKQSAEITQSPTPAPDGKVTYTVTVEDEQRNPIPGVMVQLCLDACYPSATDTHGRATYTVPEQNYKASIIALPAGYAYSSDVREFAFDEGSYELTIILKTAG